MQRAKRAAHRVPLPRQGLWLQPAGRAGRLPHREVCANENEILFTVPTPKPVASPTPPAAVATACAKGEVGPILTFLSRRQNVQGEEWHADVSRLYFTLSGVVPVAQPY